MVGRRRNVLPGLSPSTIAKALIGDALALANLNGAIMSLNFELGTLSKLAILSSM